eukprot:gene7644-9402_t
MNSISIKDFKIDKPLTENKENNGKTVYYYPLIESQHFTLAIFAFPPHTQMPIHDHPEMSVLSKVIYGSPTIKSYDWIDKQPMQFPYGKKITGIAKLNFEKTLNERDLTTITKPNSGNLHSFETKDEPSAILDLLFPPYDPQDGSERICTYYRVNNDPRYYISSNNNNNEILENQFQNNNTTIFISTTTTNTNIPNNNNNILTLSTSSSSLNNHLLNSNSNLTISSSCNTSSILSSSTSNSSDISSTLSSSTTSSSLTTSIDMMSMGTLSNGENGGIVIDFSNRDLTKIPTRLPCEKEKIESFSCSINKISVIPDDIFLNFNSLSILNLENNKYV